jgi:hypothetical protein
LVRDLRTNLLKPTSCWTSARECIAIRCPSGGTSDGPLPVLGAHLLLGADWQAVFQTSARNLEERAPSCSTQCSSAPFKNSNGHNPALCGPRSRSYLSVPGPSPTCRRAKRLSRVCQDLTFAGSPANRRNRQTALLAVFLRLASPPLETRAAATFGHDQLDAAIAFVKRVRPNVRR